jgi:hypothetical protein
MSGDHRGKIEADQSTAITNAGWSAVGTMAKGTIRAWVDLDEHIATAAFVRVGGSSNKGAPVPAGGSYVIYDCDDPLYAATSVEGKLNAAGPQTMVLHTITRRMP